jgi:hypothetical protein
MLLFSFHFDNLKLSLLGSNSDIVNNSLSSKNNVSLLVGRPCCPKGTCKFHPPFTDWPALPTPPLHRDEEHLQLCSVLLCFHDYVTLA